MECCDRDEGLLVNDYSTFSYAEAKAGKMWNQNQPLFSHWQCSVITGQLKQGEGTSPKHDQACMGSVRCNKRAAAFSHA